MRSLPILAGAIAFALLTVMVPPVRADFIPWNYGTISFANGTFGEDGTYGINIATKTGSDGLFINNGAHIPLNGLSFSEVGSVQGLVGWEISGGPVVVPPDRVLSFGPPKSTYSLSLVIQDRPTGLNDFYAPKGYFQFPGYFQGTLGDNGSTPVNVFTGPITQTQFIGQDWYRVQIRYEDGIDSVGSYAGAFVLDVKVEPSPEPSTLLLLASGLGISALAVAWRRGKACVAFFVVVEDTGQLKMS
jgi:hypothetical protein